MGSPNRGRETISREFARIAKTWDDLLITPGLADLPAVLADLDRARAELEAVRLDRANLPAATLADAEGEPNPLSYLGHELDAAEVPTDTPRRA